jgi:hypothetical protein
VDNTIITGDVPIASGTFEFARSALVFHKRSSEPFTVTYTIDAAVRPLTQWGLLHIHGKKEVTPSDSNDRVEINTSCSFDAE